MAGLGTLETFHNCCLVDCFGMQMWWWLLQSLSSCPKQSDRRGILAKTCYSCPTSPPSQIDNHSSKSPNFRRLFSRLWNYSNRLLTDLSAIEMSMHFSLMSMHAALSFPSSRLESLPVEILQLIFLHSLEINLPRASLHLSRALSSPLFYTWLIRLLFSSGNAGSRDGFFTPDFLPPPLHYWSVTAEQRQSLQTALLECRWLTLPLIRRCQREYIRHAIRTNCTHLVFEPEHQYELANLDPYFEDLSICEHGRQGKGDLILRAYQPNGSRYKVGIWFHLGKVQIRPAREVYINDNVFRLPCADPLKPGRVPYKLLCEPWTDEKLEFLQLLSAEFYLPEGCSERIVARIIRKRQIEPFCRLLKMSFRTIDCRVPESWPLQDSVFTLVQKYSSGYGSGDPFAIFLLEARWNDIPISAKEALIQHALPANSTK